MNKIIRILKQLLSSGLFKTLSVYTLASFINAAIPFLLIPFLTNKLTPTDYGIITMFATLQAFLFPLIGVNLEGAVARKFYSKDTDLSVYIANCLIIFICTTILFLVLFVAFGNIIQSYTEIPSNWIFMLPVVCAAQFLCSLALTLWQVREKSLRYVSFQISQSILNALLTFLFIVALSFNWLGRIFAISLTTILFAIFAILIVLKQYDIKFIINLTYIKNALKYGGGLIPHAIGGMLILMTNRLFLTRMVSIEESGIYGVASQICSVIAFLTISFNNAYVPWLFKKLTLNTQEDKLKIVKLTYAYFFTIMIIGLTYYMMQPIIFKLFIGVGFLSASRYCFWITLGLVFQGMYFMVTNYINYAEKTHLQALVTICVGLINIPLNYIFIKFFGALGASISFAVIFFLFFIFTWLLSAKVYKMPWLLINRS